MRVSFFAAAALAASLALTGCGKGSGYDGPGPGGDNYYGEYDMGNIFDGSFEPVAISEDNASDLSQGAIELAEQMIEDRVDFDDEELDLPMGVIGQDKNKVKANLDHIVAKLKLKGELLTMPVAATWEESCDISGTEKFSGDAPGQYSGNNPTSYHGSWTIIFDNCKEKAYWADNAWTKSNGKLSVTADGNRWIVTYDNLTEIHSDGDSFKYDGTMTIYWDTGATVYDVIIVENGETYKVKREFAGDGSVYSYYDGENGSYVVTAEVSWDVDESTTPPSYSWELEFCYPEEGCASFKADKLQLCEDNTGWFQSGSFRIESEGDWVEVTFHGCSGNFENDVTYTTSF